MTAKRPTTRTADERAAQIADWLGRHKDDVVPPRIWYDHMCWLLDNRRQLANRSRMLNGCRRSRTRTPAR